jgi:recombination protein RecT
MAGAVSNEVARREQSAAAGADARKEMRKSIEDTGSEFARALPAHVDPRRFMRAALTAVNTVPKLLECTRASVIAGLMQAAQLGLEVADVRGQAFLIPRWDSKDRCMKAGFQLGYRGMIDLAARAGITVDSDVIFEHDDYDYERGTNPRLYHKPTLTDPGEPLIYYAVAFFGDDRRPQFVMRSKTRIELHRDRFASSKNKAGEIYGPWVDHFDAMAQKTVIRMLLDKLPTSVELRQALVADAVQEDAAMGGSVYATTGTIDPMGAIDVAPSGVDPDTGEIAPPPDEDVRPSPDDAADAEFVADAKAAK